MPALTPLDRLLVSADNALRTVFGNAVAGRPTPQVAEEGSALSDEDKREAAALMRVNHVGEVCAQALYTAAALATRDEQLKAHFEQAAREETDHLAWTKQRIDELGGRTSLLNPLWYAGAFAIGLAAGRVGDKWSLGFVVETERQVEQHLDSHMARLPQGDTASRAIVEQMRDDEIRHGAAARDAGAASLPAPIQGLMRLAARVMTTTAHRV